MRQKLSFPHIGLFGKISFIIAAGIILTAILTLNISYRHMQRIYLNNYVSSSKVNMEQVKNKLFNLHTDVTVTYSKFSSAGAVRTLFTTPDYTSPAELSVNILAAKKSLQSLWDVNPLNDLNFAAIGKNGVSLSSDGWGVRVPYTDPCITDLYRLYQKSPHTIQYVPLPESLMGSSRNAPSLVAVRGLKTGMGQTPFGILLIQFSQAYFNTLCKPYGYPQNHFIITDQTGRILSGNYPDAGPVFSQFDAVLAQNGYMQEGRTDTLKINGIKSTVLYESVPYMNLYLFNIIDREMIAKEFYTSNFSVFLIAGGMAAVILFITAFITNDISRPLKRFTKEMLKASENHQSTHLPLEGSLEMRRLADAYNHMTDELKLYNTKLMDTEKQRHAAELSALQMQINPHFLYNTLASVKFLASKGDTSAVNSVINSLIGLLHNTIGKSVELVTVKEELDNLKKYTDIMSLRYENRISVMYMIHDNCLDTVIPKLLLQPIVENAFFHAFDEDGGYIKVYASLNNEDRLICQILDNGKGFDVSVMEEKNIQKRPHIGLNNIKERLRLIYDEDYKFLVNAVIGRGTKIIIELPKNKETPVP